MWYFSHKFALKAAPKVTPSSSGTIHIPYYMIFAYGYDDFIKFQQNLIAAMAYSIWIEEETVDIMHQLNDVFYSVNIKINNSTSNQELEKIGKEFYNIIAAKRKSLEHNVRKDLADLHNLKKFFKSKTSGERRTVKIYNP
ncbi:MAG: hypothetical protein EOO37_05135 [Cytophagaceae bacterium]|nr:MAG: hypothetical protein EOO37_05135 [Cytophagaceae bacterium]